jgi:probable O-glycosylation ligase (exosortase A-associated)
MFRTTFIIIIILAGLVASFFNTFAALLTYVWFAVFRPQEFIWYDISQYSISLIIGLVLVVKFAFSGISPKLNHPIIILSLLFLLFSLVAQLTATSPFNSWRWIDYLFRLICVCIIATSITNNVQRYLKLLMVIAFSFAFYSTKTGIVYLIGGGVKFIDGLGNSSFLDNNAYAIGTVMILPYVLASAQNFSPKSGLGKLLHIGMYISIPLSFLTVIGTFSRSGLLSLATAILIFILFQKKRIKKLLISISIIVLIYIFIPIPKEYLDRMETIKTFEEVQDNSAISRIHFWKVAMAMATDNPFGVGLKGYELTYDKYDFSNGKYGHNRSVHNSHLEVLTDTGFGGMIIWILLFTCSIGSAIKIQKRTKQFNLPSEQSIFYNTNSMAIIISNISYLVGGVFISMSLNEITWLSFSLISTLDILNKQDCLIVDMSMKNQ